MSLVSLKLVDFSDRELLLILDDVADSDGWASSRDMTEPVGLPEDGYRHVSSRLAWLRRYGAIERELLWDENGNPIMGPLGQKQGQRWRPTEAGRLMAYGKLSKAQYRALEAIGEGQMILAMRQMSLHYQQSSEIGATLARREWVYGMSRRNGKK